MKFKYFTFLLLSLVLSSCGVERRLAREFITKEANMAIVLNSTKKLYKTSFILPSDTTGFYLLSKANKDSIMIANSLILSNIIDSNLINNYCYGFARQFETYGIKVYNAELQKNEISKLDSNVRFINIAEMECSEFFEKTSLSDYLSDNETLWLKTANIMSWIEIYTNKNSDFVSNVFYGEGAVSDKYYGKFVVYPSTGDSYYEYMIDTLTLNAIYLQSYYNGMDNAKDLYDYWMNKYISNNTSKDYSELKSLTFESNYKIIKRKKSNNLKKLQ